MSEHGEGRRSPDLRTDCCGRSNLTYRVVDANGTAFALSAPTHESRAPDGPRHGARTHRDFSPLSARNSVAEPWGSASMKRSTNGPFYVMEFVDGAILRDRAQAEATLTRPRAGSS